MRLTGEIDNLNNVLKGRDSKMSEMMRKMENYENSTRIIRGEKETATRTFEEMKKKLGKEIEKLNINNRNQILEISELQKKMHNMIAETENVRLMLREKEKECQSLEIRVNELEGLIKGQNELQGKLVLATGDNLRLLTEIDKLNEMLREKDLKISETMREMESREDLTRLVREEKEALRKEYEEMKITLGEEIERVKLNNKNQIFEVSCLQEQWQNMILETKNMSLMLFGKEQECQSLKIKVNELEGCIKDQSELKEKLALITNENLRLLNEIDNLNTILKEKDSKMGEMENYEDLVRTTRAEKEELRKDFEEMKRVLGEEVERLNLQNKNQMHEISCLQEQWQNMILETKNMSLMLFGKEQECQLLKKEISEMEECKKAMDKLTLISTENVRLVGEIDKLKETLKNSTNEMEEKISRRFKEKEEKESLLKVTQEEKEALRSELEAIKNQHLNVIDTFEYERQKSMQEVKKAQVQEENVAKEMQNCRNRIRMLEEDNQKLSADHEKVSSELKAIMRQNDNLNVCVMEFEKEVERLNMMNQSQITEISNLRTQIDNIRYESQKLSDMLAKKNEECDVLIMRGKGMEESTRILGELEGKLTLTSRENLRLLGEINHLQEMIKAKTMEVEVKSSELVKGKEESNLLTKIINEKDYQMNLLVNEVKGLQAKIQKLMEEKAQLKDILEQNSRELEDMKQKLRMKEHEMRESKEKLLVETTREIERLNVKDQSQMAQIEDMKKDMNKLVDMVSDKDLECKSLRAKVNKLEECENCLIEQRGKLTLVSSENVRLLMEIDNLKNKTKEMEVKVYEMMKEKEDLNGMLKRKKEEIEAMRKLMERMKNEHTQEVNMLENEHQKLLREVNDGKLREQNMFDEIARSIKKIEQMSLEIQMVSNMTNNKENQIKELNREKDQLKELVQKVKGELEEALEKLKLKIQEGAALKHKLEDAVKQIEEDRMRIEEMKKQMNNIGMNLEAARHENVTLQNGLGDMIKNIKQLEEKIQGLENEKFRLEMIILEKNKEIERLNREFEVHMNKKQMMFEELFNKEKKIGHEQREQLQKKIRDITEENARLVDNMNQIHNELVEFRKKYAELETVRNKEIAEFKVQLDRLNQMSQTNIELQVKSDAERKAYETLIAQYEMTLKEAEEKIAKLITENENLTVLSCQRLKEYEQTRKKLMVLEETYKIDISEMKNQIEQFKANHSDIKELTIKSNADRTADMIQINQLKQLNENYKVELQHLNEVLEYRRLDLENMNKENRELRKSQSYLSRIAEKEGKSIQEKFDLIQSELKHLENARNEFKESTKRNSIELQRKSKELTAKIQELHNAKAKCEEAFENCQALGSQLFVKLSIPIIVLLLVSEQFLQITEELPTSERNYDGDLDFAEQLQFLETNFLSHYQAIVPATQVPLQTRIKIPEKIKIKNAPDPNVMDFERQAQISIAYLCNDTRFVRGRAHNRIRGR